MKTQKEKFDDKVGEELRRSDVCHNRISQTSNNIEDRTTTLNRDETIKRFLSRNSVLNVQLPPTLNMEPNTIADADKEKIVLKDKGFSWIRFKKLFVKYVKKPITKYRNTFAILAA